MILYSCDKIILKGNKKLVNFVFRMLLPQLRTGRARNWGNTWLDGIIVKAISFLLGGRCISAKYIVKTNLMFMLIWKIKLLDGEMDREAGPAAVHGVVKTQARLGDWTTTTNLDKYLNVKRENLHGEKYSPVLE